MTVILLISNQPIPSSRLRRTLRRSSAIFTLVCLGTCAPKSHGQNALHQESYSALPLWNLPPVKENEQAALAIVQHALQAQGGLAAWLNVSSVTTTITSTFGKEEVSSQWQESWRTHKYKRSRYMAAGGGPASPAENGDAKPIQLFREILHLATHYPGAALAISANHPGCKFAMYRTTESKVQFVEETCLGPGAVPGRLTLVWVFAPESPLPVASLLPQISGKLSTVETRTVKYADYVATDGLSTPTKISVQTAFHSATINTLSNMQFSH